MLVVLEGLDNAGKTRIAERLKYDLTNLGYEVIYTREFETEIGKEIIQMSKEKTLDPMVKSFLFACDRHIRLREYSAEDFTNKIILFDRYVPSAVAYRMAEGIERRWIENINSKFPAPDVSYYISITADESNRRNSLEKVDLGYSTTELNKVRNAYLDICNDYHMVVIDGMREFDSVYRDVLQDILKRIYNG